MNERNKPAPRNDAPTSQIKQPASGILPVKESDHG